MGKKPAVLGIYRRCRCRARACAAALILFFAGIFLCLAVSCKTTEPPGLAPPPSPVLPEFAEPEVILPVPKIIVSPYQEAVYSGNPLPIEARCEPDIPLVITYYSSMNNYWMILGGFYDAPSEPGLYFVNVNCAPGYGYGPAEEQLVEFSIKKASVQIIAEDAQSAPFNGNPRRVQASAEPDVPLSYSYYPNPELLQAALEVFSRPDAEGRTALSSALQSFTRVERAPVEQGVYYVLIYFPGNSRYEPAHREVEFTIGPPVRRN